MRCRGFWLPVLAAAVWASSAGSFALADDVWVETVDWLPTSSVRLAPTSYVLPTSYVVPTSYIAPTVYSTSYVIDGALTPTSYVVPSYYETRFRRSLFGRRWIPTGRTRYYTPTSFVTPTTFVSSTRYFPTTLYYPTAYYAPTTYRTVVPTVLDRSVVATEYVRDSNVCCPDATPVALAPTRVIVPERSSGSSAARTRRPEVRSEPQDEDDDPALSSNVDEPARAPAAAPAPRPRAAQENSGVRRPAETARPQQDQGGSPPTAPAAERRDTPARPDAAPKPSVQPAPEPAPSLAPAPAPAAEKPRAPAGDDFLNEPAPLPTVPDGAEVRSESRKPVYDAARAVRASSRNVLFGRVRERETSEPEEGVRVVLSSRTNAFTDKDAWTDAFGRFAVRVPDGDWTVKVAMPSGNVYAVSEITVSNGQISDDLGRDIPSLTITR